MTVEINNLEDMCALMCDNIIPDHKYCKRCGRKLKSETAKQLGYGPICYKKIQNKSQFQKKLF